MATDASGADRPVWRIGLGFTGTGEKDPMDDAALAELAALCTPGDVCISSALHAAVGLWLEFGYAPLSAPYGAGEPAAYLVLVDPAMGRQRVWLYQAGALHKASFAFVLLLLATAIIVMLWHLLFEPTAS